VHPISTEEIMNSIKTSTENAPGLDKVTLEQIKSVLLGQLMTMFNSWLLIGQVPRLFKDGVTTLIPKSEETSDPANYRPITMSSSFVRIFHKILARRLTNNLPISIRQKAFIPVDGCGENVFLLDSIIKEAQRKLKSICVTYLDVAKAFDSVSHQTIKRCPVRLRIPDPLVGYVENIYNNTYTHLKVRKTMGPPIQCLRGARQGDPLSAVIFNCVIDEVLCTLPQEIGYPLGDDLNINSMAYADDLILLYSTVAGQQDLLDSATKIFADGGLCLNLAKCATMRIDIDGRKKKWVMNSTPQLKINNGLIRTMGIAETYKYMGLQAGVKEARKEYRT